MVETKNKILHAAIEIWGKDMTHSLEDIAHHLGISRRTLHRHYQGREDLMHSVISHIVDEYLFNIREIMQLPLSNQEKLKAFLAYDIRSSSKYTVFCHSRRAPLTEGAPQNDNIKAIQEIMVRLFSGMIKEGLVREELPVSWLELFYTSVVETALNSIELGMSQEKSIELAWLCFCGGIKQENKQNKPK